MERTATRTASRVQDRYASDGDDSSDDEIQILDLEDHYANKLVKKTANKSNQQAKKRTVDQFKKKLDQVNSKEWNAFRCSFVDKRTGVRSCPHNAEPVDSNYWVSGRDYKPKKYRGKLCQDHWRVTKKALKKLGVCFDDKPSYDRTKANAKSTKSKTVSKKARTQTVDLGPPPKPLSFDDLKAFSEDPEDQDLARRFKAMGGDFGKISQYLSEAYVPPKVTPMGPSPTSTISPSPMPPATPAEPKAAPRNLLASSRLLRGEFGTATSFHEQAAAKIQQHRLQQPDSWFYVQDMDIDVVN